MDQKQYFQAYLKLFTKPEFPLLLSYNIFEPQSIDSEPLPVLISNMFIANDDDNLDDELGIEYNPFVTYSLNKNYVVCVLYKFSVGAYELLMIIYDNEGNIQETDVVAGTYFNGDEMVYKAAQMISPETGFIVEGRLAESREEVLNNQTNLKTKITLSEIGEINYSILEN